MSIQKINICLLFIGGLLLSVLLSSCDSMINDDLPPCKNVNLLKFKYDYNMKFADAFSAEVTSVSVWIFNSDGVLVKQLSESGTALAEDDYAMELDLPAGRYDIVAWCGLEGETPFSIDTDSPSAIHHLSTTLALEDDETVYGGRKSEEVFPGLYHGIVRNAEIIRDETRPVTNEIIVSLVKDTNYIKILLQNLDGRIMNKEDFSFHITAYNSQLSHENEILSFEKFCYRPWNLSLGSTESSLVTGGRSGTVTSVTSVLAELSSSRLMDNSESKLVVNRNSDGKEIIRIPLVDYLLLVKGNYRQMSNQEYLDRQDEYSMTFFLDDNLNWYSALGIYVNSWHVVPPQDSELK